MEAQTRTVRLEAEVYVSKCEICGEEELATVDDFRRHRDPSTGVLTDKVFPNGWHYESHSEVRVGKAGSWMPELEPRREWRLCKKHLEVMRDRVAAIVAEECAKVL